MSFKLLTEYHLEFLSLKGGYTGSSESTLVKRSHCWKTHVTAHLRIDSGSLVVEMDSLPQRLMPGFGLKSVQGHIILIHLKFMIDNMILFLK